MRKACGCTPHPQSDRRLLDDVRRGLGRSRSAKMRAERSATVADVLRAKQSDVDHGPTKLLAREFPMRLPIRERCLATPCGIRTHNSLRKSDFMYSEPAVGLFLKSHAANEGSCSDVTFDRCSLDRQLASRDAGGSRTHFNRVAAGCLTVGLQRHAANIVTERLDATEVHVEATHLGRQLPCKSASPAVTLPGHRHP